jgi:hypothetical protein
MPFLADGFENGVANDGQVVPMALPNDGAKWAVRGVCLKRGA